MWTEIIMDKNKPSRKRDAEAIEDNKQVTPAREQIHPLADGLTGLCGTCQCKEPSIPSQANGCLACPILPCSECGFEMGYSLPQCNCILNVLGTRN